MKINAQRLLDNLQRYAKIGEAQKTGVERIALSEEDREARDLLKQQMLEAGLEVLIDRIGNMIGIRKGLRDVPPVTMGSHLDTVYQGGCYDGALGVLAGLEVIQSLNDANVITEKPIALINFTNEEGVRFAPDMMGSHVFAHPELLDEILESPAYDNAQDTVGSRLKAIGYSGDMPCGSMEPDSFLELHIEQGPTLELEKTDIGAVEMVQGIYWTLYTIKGQANHAGTTPVPYRKDAGYAASEVMHYIGDYSRKANSQVLTTVGTISFEPNAINIVPEKAGFTLDLRSVDYEALKQGQIDIDQKIKAVVQAVGLSLEREEMVRFAPVQFDKEVVGLVADEAEALGLSVKRMPSGAGHDAQMMASVCPSAMIFVPSVEGISHNVKELTHPVDLENGTNVLLNAVLRRAGED
ncbi:MAG: Zn-dependent hydrolase [Roseivirga sp.]|nr:Zn-dependent hydrolase [Roseivirga sp.]